MTSSTIDRKRRHIVKLLLVAVGSSIIEPRDSSACAIPQLPDIRLLDDFPGTVGSYDWTNFAYKVVPTRQTKENPGGIPSLQVGDEWVKRVGISIPKDIENHLIFSLTASFDDSDLPEDYRCAGLILILESELRVIDPRDRYFSVKGHQVILHAKFTKNAVPYIRTRIKLASKYSRIGVIASVETPDRGILNVPRDIKVPEPYAGLCGWGGIYATSPSEVIRLKRMHSW